MVQAIYLNTCFFCVVVFLKGVLSKCVQCQNRINRRILYYTTKTKYVVFARESSTGLPCLVCLASKLSLQPKSLNTSQIGRGEGAGELILFCIIRTIAFSTFNSVGVV